VPDNSKKRAKLLHCNVPLLLLTPDHIRSLLQVVEPSAIMENSRSVDPAKLKKVLNTLINLPDLKVLQAMVVARFSNEDVTNLSLHCFIWQSLHGKMVKGLKAHVSGPLLPPSPQPDCTKGLCNCAIDDAATLRIEEGSCATGIGSCEHGIAMTLCPLLPWPLPLVTPKPSLVSESTAAVKKQKSWNRVYYTRKKLHATAAVATSASATAATVAAAADPWSDKTDGTVRTPADYKMAKYQHVEPAVEDILHAGKVEGQAAVLHAVANHPSLAPACKLAKINSSKEQAAYNFFSSNLLV
jgi:hypothetical protein